MGGVWIAAASMLQAIAGQGQSAPLQPIGKWTVNYTNSSCTLSRRYGPTDGPIDLTLQPEPIGAKITLAVIQPGTYRKAGRGDAVVELAPGKLAVTGIYVAGPAQDSGRRITNVFLSEAPDALWAAEAISIRVPDSPTVTLATPNLAGAAAALRTCENQLLQSWQVDPETVHRATTQAVAINEQDWIGYNDYPVEALRNRKQGTVRILWTIGTDARVTDCRVVVSSGDKNLDHGTCTTLVRRAHYSSPALDRDGKPVVSYGLRSAIWSIP